MNINFGGALAHFGGVQLVANHALDEFRPAIELGYKVTLSPHVRAKINKSLLDTFGKKVNVLIGNGCIYAHPNVIKRIEEAAKNRV